MTSIEVASASVSPRTKNETAWDKFGRESGLDKTSSWRLPKFSLRKAVQFWQSPEGYNYFPCLLNHDPADLQDDVGNSLTATGIISVLVLSIAAGSADSVMNSMDADNMWDVMIGTGSAKYAAGIAQACGYLSLVLAIVATFYIVNLYSEVVRVPVEAFPAYLDLIGPHYFGMIWILPTLSIWFYLATATIRLTVTSHIWFGWFVIVVACAFGAIASRMIFFTDVTHAMVVVIVGQCKKEKAEMDAKEGGEEKKTA